ncbi:MAG: nucleotidyltransferase domain-containing protein [Nitrospirae bacterium]|nr:nucleotidyltransferase domain-containing protein [Nitrospirota bacterium]
MLHEMSQELAERLSRLAQHFGLHLIVQFGSTVAGPTHARSDLDLAVQLTGPDLSLRRVLDIQAALADLFPGQDVDLAILNRADPLFLKKITEQCRLLYGAPQDLALLRLSAFKRYQDFRPYLEIERRFVSRRLASLTAESRAS